MVAKDAEVQHGVFTLAQFWAHGGTKEALQHRLDTGTWRTVSYRGMYRIGGCPGSWEQELHALVLATGPVAAASHRSAAALLRIPGFARRGGIEVVTARRQRDRTPGARVHSSRVLPPDHLTVVEGIVTTRVARTLLDLAGVIPAPGTERALDNCLARKLVTLDAVRVATDLLARRGRPGITVMRHLLEERTEGYIAPESGLEARVLEVLRCGGLPEPVRQLDVGDANDWIGRVDLAYPDRRVIIEIDSDLHHGTYVDRRADHVRDRRLLAAGWRVERVTEGELGRLGVLVNRLRRLLESPAA